MRNRDPFSDFIQDHFNHFPVSRGIELHGGIDAAHQDRTDVVNENGDDIEPGSMAIGQLFYRIAMLIFDAVPPEFIQQLPASLVQLDR